MIKKLTLKGFKGYADESLEFRPLTLLTGLNSTGKSSCFQAILYTLFYNGSKNAQALLSASGLMDFSFIGNRNRYTNAKQYSIKMETTIGRMSIEAYPKGASGISSSKDLFDLEREIYYLSANRLGYDPDLETVSLFYKVGLQGEFVFGTFDNEKSRALDSSLLRMRDSDTLSSQLNWWLNYILGISLEMETEKVTSSKVKFYFKSDGLPNIEPRSLGVGVSYLAKILITCLRAEQGDILMIENPEIHLHPAAQARLAEFFVMVANAGRQVLLETHSENILNKVRYSVFKGELDPKKALLYYKKGITEPFIRLTYSSNGRYDGEFPDGFYDATLYELLEMD